VIDPMFSSFEDFLWRWIDFMLVVRSSCVFNFLAIMLAIASFISGSLRVICILDLND